MFFISPSFCRETPLYVQGEVIVKFTSQTTSTKSIQTFTQKKGMKIKKNLPLFSRLKKSNVAVLSSQLTTQEMISKLQNDPTIEYVQPIYIRKPLEVIPNDTRYNQQWALPRISAPYAWGITTGDNKNVVAVVDSGINYSHPDISNNMWQNLAELEGLPEIDDDNNGYKDDIYGYNFAYNHPNPMDTDSHGTHVAGIIGAVGNNQQGVSGVNWSVQLMALNSMRDGNFRDDDLIEAISYAVMMKKDFGEKVVVINASWGGSGGQNGDTLYEAIEEAGRAGITFVAAAGNESENNDLTPLYPASYNLPNIVSVAAFDKNESLWSYSNYGVSSVHLSAPGTNILSTVPFTEYVALEANGVVYESNSLEFSGKTETGGITGLFIDCGLGETDDFPLETSGYIALIERGALYFSEKVTNAYEAGAVGVVIYNNIPDDQPDGGLINATLGSAGNWLPTIFISKSDGLKLKELLSGLGTDLQATLFNTILPESYGLKSGTSMATPFVSGAISLLCSAYPEDTVARNTFRIIDGVKPMSKVVDREKLITGGQLDLQGAFNCTYPPLGDINNDGKINISDVIRCLRMSLELDEQDLRVADMNGDWVINISDVILLLRKAIGLD